MPPPASNGTGRPYSIGPRRLRLITWPCDLDLWPWRSWRTLLIRVVVLHPYTKFEVCRPCRSEDMAHDCVSALMGVVTLIFDLFTSKLVCESHQRWGTFLPNLGTLILNYSLCTRHTDGQTDGQTQRLLPLPYGRRIINVCVYVHCVQKNHFCFLA